jgi:hypothetical protein
MSGEQEWRSQSVVAFLLDPGAWQGHSIQIVHSPRPVEKPHPDRFSSLAVLPHALPPAPFREDRRHDSLAITHP